MASLDAIVTARVTPETHAAIETLARDEDRSLGNVIRRLILEGLERRADRRYAFLRAEAARLARSI